MWPNPQETSKSLMENFIFFAVCVNSGLFVIIFSITNITIIYFVITVLVQKN